MAATVAATDVWDESVRIDISDEGSLEIKASDIFRRGLSHNGGTGVGLALGQELTGSAGGRLVVTSRAPTTFSLVLPTG
jgi:sensor histidine kinase regulating citrate/malate metabolism